VISLDVDRDRVRSILKEAYTICHETLNVDFEITQDQFISQIEPYLACNRIASVPIPIRLPSKRHPELIIETHIQKKSVIARMLDKNKRIHLNRFLTSL
jgi:hypothetical protein